MAEEQVLGFKPARRIEEVNDEHCERMQEREHRSRSCDDSTRPCDSQAGWDFRKGQPLCSRTNASPFSKPHQTAARRRGDAAADLDQCEREVMEWEGGDLTSTALPMDPLPGVA